MSYRKLLIAAALCLSGNTAFAQGSGGTLLPADPGLWRFDVDAGGQSQRLSRFRYGDLRVGFPVGGSQPLGDYFNERDRAAGYNFGGRAAYGLPMPFLGAPVDVYGRFQYTRVSATSRATEGDPANEFYVPYIDGAVRTTLAGGAVVGLFNNSESQLQRSMTSYEGEAGIRQHYMFGGFRVSPGAFFAFQRMEQRDRLVTFAATDPTGHTLDANVNSNHYRAGGTLGVAHPFIVDNLLWVGNAGAGVDFVRARYTGTQSFSGLVFDLPFEQSASASDSRNRVGAFASLETGFVYVLFPGASVSILGNMRYTTAVPYVRYPTAITGTNTVSGPATLAFQSQWNFGAAASFSIKF